MLGISDPNPHRRTKPEVLRRGELFPWAKFIATNRHCSLDREIVQNRAGSLERSNHIIAATRRPWPMSASLDTRRFPGLPSKLVGNGSVGDNQTVPSGAPSLSRPPSEQAGCRPPAPAARENCSWQSECSAFLKTQFLLRPPLSFPSSPFRWPFCHRPQVAPHARRGARVH